MKKILIIGAGMAGLTAARLLNKAGQTAVTVLDKGRGFGGRMATRRLGEARCDYGAQYFSAKTSEFQMLVAEAEKAGDLRKWQPDHLADGYPRWVGADGMTRFPKFLAEGLDVKRNTRVICLSAKEDGWELGTEAGDHYHADVVIATMPAPQALDLLENSELALPNTESELSRIVYDPCLAVLARLDRPVSFNSFSPNEKKGGQVISWMANNQSKGITDKPCVTIHATPDFSRKNLDDDLQKVGAKLLDLAKPLIGPAEVTEWQIHRWRYSLARERHPQNFWKAGTEFPLFFGGDGFGAGNVEGAFLSGKGMAEAVCDE